MGFFIISDYLYKNTDILRKKPMLVFWLRLKIESEIAIFTKKCNFEIQLFPEAKILTWVFLAKNVVFCGSNYLKLKNLC